MQTQKNILDLYYEYRVVTLANKNGDKIIDKIDKILIDNYSEKRTTHNTNFTKTGLMC